jgi:predicted ATPase
VLGQARAQLGRTTEGIARSFARGLAGLLEIGMRLTETDFRESIALAQKMSAKAWELRATTSLARLLPSRDRRNEARTMLAEIYCWFTAGFNTADFKDAKSMLDQLNA